MNKFLYDMAVPASRLLLRALTKGGLFDFPRTVRVESTDYCNANCVTCTREIMTRSKGVMSMELFKKVVDECAAYKISSLHLHNFGEPFLDARIYEKIAYAKEKGINTRLFSNVSILNEERATKAILSGLDKIKISMDGNTKETFEDIRRGLSFDKVVAGIETLVRLKLQLGSKTPEIGLVFVETDKNRHEKEDFVKRWKGKVDSIDISSYHNWGGSLNEGAKDFRRLPCLRVWQTFTVLWNGDVAICCMDYDGKVILGNVNEQSIHSIFNSAKYKEAREVHLKGEFEKIPICLKCEARR